VENFPQNHGSRRFHCKRGPHMAAMEKSAVAARKFLRISLATSLPQDSQVELCSARPVLTTRL
jgi:hypothetical protein